MQMKPLQVLEIPFLTQRGINLLTLAGKLMHITHTYISRWKAWRLHPV